MRNSTAALDTCRVSKCDTSKDKNGSWDKHHVLLEGCAVLPLHHLHPPSQCSPCCILGLFVSPSHLCLQHQVLDLAYISLKFDDQEKLKEWVLHYRQLLDWLMFIFLHQFVLHAKFKKTSILRVGTLYFTGCKGNDDMQPGKRWAKL